MVNNFTFMQIPYAWNQLTSDLFHSINSKCPSLFFYVLVHISSTKKFHENMKLINFLNRIMLPHEIFILHNIWMLQVFGHAKFSEHLLKNLISQLWVFINLSGLINILATKSFYLNFINISLRPWAQLPPTFYIKNHPLRIKRTIKNLHILS